MKLLSDDTLYIDENTIFIAKKGKNYDVEKIIDIAKEKKPIDIVSNIKKENVKYIKNIKRYEDEYIKNYLITPTIIGITGTNGKTSTSTIIYETLKRLNKKVMLIGSNGIYFKDLEFKTRNTTPSKLTILYFINKYLDNDSYLVIELSSQSYNRIKSFKIDYLIFTNLNNEHLDYHKTMKKYLKAKLRIINLLKDKSNLFVNEDDEYGKNILKKYNYAKKYSLNDVKIYSINPIIYEFQNKRYEYKLNGKFNIYNIISAYKLLIKFINKEQIDQEIIKINEIKGRNNIYEYKDNYIVIDYAHTPFSVKNIMENYYSQKHNNIYVLIGFGGNKDKEKRSLMINEITKYTNNIIISEDNSRNELFIDILKSSLKEELNNLIVIQDRKEAIKYAISKLTHNDYLLILGKGNEDYIIKNNQISHYNDYEEIKKWIQ